MKTTTINHAYTAEIKSSRMKKILGDADPCDWEKLIRDEVLYNMGDTVGEEVDYIDDFDICDYESPAIGTYYAVRCAFTENYTVTDDCLDQIESIDYVPCMSDEHKIWLGRRLLDWWGIHDCISGGDATRALKNMSVVLDWQSMGGFVNCYPLSGGGYTELFICDEVEYLNWLDEESRENNEESAKEFCGRALHACGSFTDEYVDYLLDW